MEEEERQKMIEKKEEVEEMEEEERQKMIEKKEEVEEETRRR